MPDKMTQDQNKKEQQEQIQAQLGLIKSTVDEACLALEEKINHTMDVHKKIELRSILISPIKNDICCLTELQNRIKKMSATPVISEQEWGSLLGHIQAVSEVMDVYMEKRPENIFKKFVRKARSSLNRILGIEMSSGKYNTRATLFSVKDLVTPVSDSGKKLTK